MSTMSSHPPGPPPRYTAIVAKVYPYSLRPVLFLTSLLGAIYALVIAVQALQSRASSFTSNYLQTINLIMAIIYFGVAGVEIYGFIAAILQKVTFAKMLYILAPLGIVLTLAGQIMKVAVHFTGKNDLIYRCVQQTQGTTYYDGNGNLQVITADQANSICLSSWNNGSWTVFAWLVVTFVLSLLFGSVAIQYYKQLVDPSLVRTRQGMFQRTNQPQAYPLQQYPPQQQEWMVPPYPGPPAESTPLEKSDYQPTWGGSAGFSGGLREEEEAWVRAQQSGTTGRNDIPRNSAEDAAWERARTEGVTAHLTGQGRRADGQV